MNFVAKNLAIEMLRANETSAMLNEEKNNVEKIRIGGNRGDGILYLNFYTYKRKSKINMSRERVNKFTLMVPVQPNQRYIEYQIERNALKE